MRSPPAEPAPIAAPRGLRAAAVVLTLIGAAVSVYLLAVELSHGQVPLACSTAGWVNCDLVTSSAQSRLGGVPVVLLGVAWFAVLLALLALEGRISAFASPWLLLAWTAAGLLMVFYLIYAELFLIGALCAWCTVVHAVIIGLFLVQLARTQPASAS